MEKLATTTAVFIATVIGTLEKMGVLDRVMESFWRAQRKIMQPEMVQAAKPNEDDDAFIKDAEADGWGRDMPRPVYP
jgi:hypothetical protein